MDKCLIGQHTQYTLRYSLGQEWRCFCTYVHASGSWEWDYIHYYTEVNNVSIISGVPSVLAVKPLKM